jgi:hypothetical protein
MVRYFPIPTGVIIREPSIVVDHPVAVRTHLGCQFLSDSFLNLSVEFISICSDFSYQHRGEAGSDRRLNEILESS